MSTLAVSPPSYPDTPDADGVISRGHLGVHHITKADEHNHLDLAKIMNEGNQASAESVRFFFLPGDVADDGSRVAHAAVREELDRLEVLSGDRVERERFESDQDSALEALPEQGLLGTQLGPNKNGKKW
jgi:hypothetical protein